MEKEKRVKILMSMSYEALFAKMSTEIKTISVNAIFDDRVIPGVLRTFTNKDQNVCLVENLYSGLKPTIIGIRTFDLNILGCIMAILDEKSTDTTLKKDFWIGISYITTFGYNRIWELDEKCQIMIYASLICLKEISLSKSLIESEDVLIEHNILDITDQIYEYIDILNSILSNDKDPYYLRGIQELKTKKFYNSMCQIKYNRKVILRKTCKLDSEEFYNTNNDPSTIVINYCEKTQKVDLSYLYNIESKQDIKITFLYEFFKVYPKIADIYNDRLTIHDLVRRVLKEFKFNFEDAEALFDFISNNDFLLHKCIR